MSTATAPAPAPATTAALEPAKPATSSSLIRTPGDFVDAMKRWAGHFNVLSPFTNIAGLAESHIIIPAVVNIDANPAKDGPGDVYDGLPFLKGDEVALAKRGLRKIAECAGISTRTYRTDPRTIPYYWEVKAIASYRGIDGAIVEREATVEWDLRDGSPRLKGWKPDQVSEGRKNGLRNCETRAINAAIREFGVKQKYTPAELRKPFVVLRVVFQPDTSDPEIKKLVTENALRGTAQLYPHGAGVPAAAEPELLDTIDAETVPTTSTTGDRTPAPAATTPPDDPPVEGAVRIEKIETRTGTTPARDGKPARNWTRYVIVDSLGAEHSTFDQALADAAVKFRNARAWVEITEEQDGNYRNLVEITPAGQQPGLPLDAKL